MSTAGWKKLDEKEWLVRLIKINICSKGILEATPLSRQNIVLPTPKLMINTPLRQ